MTLFRVMEIDAVASIVRGIHRIVGERLKSLYGDEQRRHDPDTSDLRSRTICDPGLV
jgi:hypothetical protein